MSLAVRSRVQRYRAKMKASGLRPMQIWVPDIKRAGFSEELKRQVRMVVEADEKDTALLCFMDTIFNEVEGSW